MGTGCCCCKKDQLVSSEYLPAPQYIRIGLRTQDSATTMAGYFNEPMLSLEETLKPFDGKIYRLSYYINEAKMKCHYPSEHNLTHDESASIYIYTLKWNDRCLYDHVETALNSNDRSTLQPWFKYFKLLKGALNKLPTSKADIWQGSPFDDKLKDQLNSNSSSFYTSLCFCAPMMNDVTEYLQKTTAKKIILVCYQSVNGKIVTGYTANRFQEVIIWPGMKLEALKSAVTNTYYLWTFRAVGDSGECY